jgi:hypothetical protein
MLSGDKLPGPKSWFSRLHAMVANFMYQLDWDIRCPDIWSNYSECVHEGIWG